MRAHRLEPTRFRSDTVPCVYASDHLDENPVEPALSMAPSRLERVLK